MRRRFQTVDVFTESPFLGNPVAVVLDSEDLTTEDMLAITRWMNLSETTFVLPAESPQADYKLRIFTLDREMPFAGHPTLGSCRAWLEAGGTPRNEGEVIQECGAGLIRIRRADERLAFAAPPLVRGGEPDEAEIRHACDFLKLEREAVVEFRWIDNGPGWLGVLLPSAEAVLAVKAPGSYPQRMDIGLIGPYPEGSDIAWELRALFSDHTGAVREDPITGSLNASAAQWLFESGRATSPYLAAQGRVIGREGRIHVDRDDTGDIWIGGSTIPIVDGHIEA